MMKVLGIGHRRDMFFRIVSVLLLPLSRLHSVFLISSTVLTSFCYRYRQTTFQQTP